jgi:two-component system response regulator HydG
MNSKNLSILVVDDNFDICDVIKDWLEDEDFTVITSSSGNKAIRLLQKETFDVIISDVKMSDGTGIDLLKGIKDLKLHPKMIIMMTGFSDLAEEDFFSLGATHFYNKPLKLEEITDLIKSTLSYP